MMVILKASLDGTMRIIRSILLWMKNEQTGESAVIKEKMRP